MSALRNLRVLELSDRVVGEYCAKLLADFGARIIKVEPPETGSATRHVGPFAAGPHTADSSGLFAYLNTNKRSAVLDLTARSGREALHSLLADTDILIDDHANGYLQSLGIDPVTLGSTYPRLIVCTITPFGYDAPPTMQPAYPLNIFHSSGWGYHSPGEPDLSKPPLSGAGRFHVDYEAGLCAAVALLAAVYWRSISGQGQFIDVSQREALASLCDYVLGQMVAGTMEPNNRRQAFDLRGPATIFQCLDGYVYLWLSEPAHWEGMRTLMGDPAWMAEFPERWLELHVTEERVVQCRAQIARWMLGQQKSAIVAGAQKLGVIGVPVNTVKDLLESEQLRFREFFTRVDHPVLGPLPYPTVAYRLSITPARIETVAPLLGQHTDPVLRDVTARGQQLQRALPAQSNSFTRSDRGPLHGIRVVELTKIWAGPYTGKLLAFLGAEVIRVESHDSLDATRRYGVGDVNEAPGFQAVNPGKGSVQINVRTEEGRRLLGELIKVSDVFIENLRPGAATRLGLGYAALSALNPRIIAVSMSMYGHDGPLSYQTGYAPCFSALAGICQQVGYENGPPQLLNIRYGDSTYGTTAAFAALVALLHRQHTGQGQFIDVSAVESLAALLGDSFMEFSLTGNIPSRHGNRHPDMAPHGCYPCKANEWISIGIGNSQEWQALCLAMQRPDLSSDLRYADLQSRQTAAADLDTLLAGWTRNHTARELETMLRSRGIAAFKSLNTIDLVSDQQLWEREFYRTVTDGQGRSTPIVGAPWRLSATPVSIDRGAPRLGEYNDYVFGELLGLSHAQRQQLINAKVIY